MPDQIREAQNFTFDKLSGIYTLCDKYIIDDIREWALSWLKEILPTSEDDICKMGGVYTSASLVARVIAFARDADLPQFLPLAYYAIATYPWSKDDEFSSFSEAGDSLSEHDGYRIEVGRNAIHAEVLGRAFSCLPDIGLPGRSTCMAAMVNGGTCAKVRQRVWSEPAELVAEVLRSPLEYLDRRVKTPPRNWCSSCTLEAVTQAALMRHALYERLSSFFLLSK
ncbi:hypothetical protein M407DRAFT_21149 [Tulasnella calospora MUT 4182]|uniref:Uncharacterized protein n=1 Tax=Tulasnella calospora MUT 4182 TaxID=1051891 RepID=A0A0C3L782_9AGAM|nr:hypothetical protein M407DRAFT_21149 [Tulasnella calospora MUT 4182]